MKAAKFVTRDSPERHYKYLMTVEEADETNDEKEKEIVER